jgi:hypothetical protein
LHAFSFWSDIAGIGCPILEQRGCAAAGSKQNGGDYDHTADGSLFHIQISYLS